MAGGRVELGDVVVLCDRPLEELGPSLQALVRSRFVAEAQRGRTFTYEISHPLIQETVYEGIVGARRVVLHRQVGRVLLTMGRLGEAAPHFARSADVGDAEALAVLSDALHQAEERGRLRRGAADPRPPSSSSSRPVTAAGSRWPTPSSDGPSGSSTTGPTPTSRPPSTPCGPSTPTSRAAATCSSGPASSPASPASWPGGRASSTRPPPPPSRPSTSSPGPATAPARCWPPSRWPT